jgi:hypothetical protein
MSDYKNPFGPKKSSAVSEMTQKIIKDIQIREQTEQERAKEEPLIPDVSAIRVEKARKNIDRKTTRTVNISIRIKENTLHKLDELVYKKGAEGIQRKERPMKRNGYIELAIEELIKKEGING